MPRSQPPDRARERRGSRVSMSRGRRRRYGRVSEQPVLLLIVGGCLGVATTAAGTSLTKGVSVVSVLAASTAVGLAAAGLFAVGHFFQSHFPERAPRRIGADPAATVPPEIRRRISALLADA